MPGPNIVNRARQAQQAAAVQRSAYYLTDPNTTEIMGLPVTDAIRENGLILTQQEALTLVASGAITSDKAAAEKAATEMKDRLDALAKRQQAEADALNAANEAASAATLHNAGEQTVSQSDLDKSNEAIMAGTKSASEVDTHLATPPAGDAAPAAPPADPAPASAEPQPSWADQQHAS